MVYEREKPFVDVADFEVYAADEHQLRLLMRDWRKGRATRTVWDMIADGYVTLFSLAVVVAMVVSGIMSVQQSAAGCSDQGCTTARELLPWLTLAAVLLAAVTIARIFGPVIASAAEGFWLFDAPIRRGRLLARRLAGVVAGALVLGSVLAGFVTMLTGLAMPAVAVWAVAIGLAAAAVLAFAAVEQAAERTLPLAILQGLAGVLAVSVLGVMVAVQARALDVELGLARSGLAGLVVLVVAGAGLVVFLVLAFSRIEHVRRARLVSGGALLSGMQGAMFALDFALMRDILVERRWVVRGHVHPVRGRSTGRATLIWRELEKLLRNPRGVLVLMASAIVPHALLALGLGNLTPPIAAIVLMFVLIPFFDSLRVLSRTKGLARAFPMSTAELTGALTAVPAGLAVLWALAAAPAWILSGRAPATLAGLGHALTYGFVTAVAGLIAAIRWVSARSADYSMPMVATGVGAMPPGLAFNLIRGFDMVAFITLPLLVGWSPVVSLGIATICYLVLRSGGINTQDLMERQEEAQRELSALRSGQSAPTPSGEKIGYTRTRRPGTR